MTHLRRAGMLAALGAVVILMALGVGVAVSQAPAAPAGSSGCVACHTDRATLEPLVQPFPELPSEGEG